MVRGVIWYLGKLEIALERDLDLGGLGTFGCVGKRGDLDKIWGFVLKDEEVIG